MSSFKAAIGSVSLDIARERGFTGLHQEELGIQVNFSYQYYSLAFIFPLHTNQYNEAFSLPFTCFGRIVYPWLILSLSKSREKLSDWAKLHGLVL